MLLNLIYTPNKTLLLLLFDCWVYSTWSPYGVADVCEEKSKVDSPFIIFKKNETASNFVVLVIKDVIVEKGIKI